jgi:hypothetical protein
MEIGPDTFGPRLTYLFISLKEVIMMMSLGRLGPT